MKKLSDKIELLIAVEVATKGVGYYKKNNWDKGTDTFADCQDYVNLKFEIVAKDKQTGKIFKTEPVKKPTDINDLDREPRLSLFRPTKITRYIPYTALAVKNLNYIVGDLQVLADTLTDLFAKKPENTTKALEKKFG